MYFLRSAILLSVIPAVYGGSSPSFARPPVLGVDVGGTGCTTAECALAALGGAKRGQNDDINALLNLTTPLAITEGGCGGTDAASCRAGISGAKSGVNSDITVLNALTHIVAAQAVESSMTTDGAVIEARNSSLTANQLYTTFFATGRIYAGVSGIINIQPGSDILGGIGLTGYVYNTLPHSIVYTAGNFVAGRSYTIVTTGTTNFTAIGAADNNPGTFFQATGVGSGTGTARGSQNNGVAIFGEAICGADQSSCWGLNTATNDRDLLLGNHPAFVLGYEVDLNIFNSGSTANAIGIILGGPAQPKAGQAFSIGTIGVGKFTTAINVSSGSVLEGNDAVIVGAVSSLLTAPLGVGSPSNNVVFFNDDIDAVLYDPNPLTDHAQVVANNGTSGCLAAGTYTAGAFVVGASYTIVSAGTTNFIAIGAADNNPGTPFVATGPGSGSGIAQATLIYTINGGVVDTANGGAAATLTGSVANGSITGLFTLGKGLYSSAPPTTTTLSGTGCTGAPAATLTWVSRGHAVQLRSIPRGANSGFIIQDVISGAGLGLTLAPGNLTITPAQSIGINNIGINLLPIGAGVVSFTYLTSPGLLHNTSTGGIASYSAANLAAVPANFVADHRLTVTLGTTTYYIPMTTTAF